MGGYALEVAVACQVREFGDQVKAQRELRQRILATGKLRLDC